MGEKVRWGVEGRDGQRDTGWCAIGQGGVAHPARPARHGQHLAVYLSGLGGGDAEGVGDAIHLAEAVLDRLAQLQGQQARDVAAAGKGQRRGAFEHLSPAGGRYPPDGFGCVPGVVACGGDIAEIGLAGSAHHLTHIWTGSGGLRPGCDPLTRDEAPCRLGGRAFRHLLSSESNPLGGTYGPFYGLAVTYGRHDVVAIATFGETATLGGAVL